MKRTKPYPLKNWWSPEGRQWIFPQNGQGSNLVSLKDICNRVMGYSYLVSKFEALLTDGYGADDLTDEQFNNLMLFWQEGEEDECED